MDRTSLLALVGRCLLPEWDPGLFPARVAPGIVIVKAVVDHKHLNRAVVVERLGVGRTVARAEVTVKLHALWGALRLVDDRGREWRTFDQGRSWADGGGAYWGFRKDPAAACWAFPLGGPGDLAEFSAERNRERDP